MRATDAFGDLDDEWSVEEDCRDIAVARNGDYTIRAARSDGNGRDWIHVSLHCPRSENTPSSTRTGGIGVIKKVKCGSRYDARKATRRMASARQRLLMDVLFNDNEQTA